MERAVERPGSRAARVLPALHLVFPADPAAVRRALKTAMAVFRSLPLCERHCGVAEIVLAEVLNNVVEHAFSGQAWGTVEVLVERTETSLTFLIRDDGAPMPDNMLPPGRALDLDVATDDLPEGGFGWFLIRELTEDLAYRRSAGRNELSYRLPLAVKMPDA